MPSKPKPRTVTAEEQDLRARLEIAEKSVREILSDESDALFVAGAGGARLFALKGADLSYCDEMQGFLFSKPLPAENFETRFLAPPAEA